MVRTTNFWTSQGVSFDAPKYLTSSNTYAVVTTSAMAASLVVGLLVPDFTGAIISLVCAGVSVGADMIAFYGVRRNWMQAINSAIAESGVDWRSILATK